MKNTQEMTRPAPDFTLLDQDDKPVRLGDLLAAKKPVFLVFYPGDFTPTCTKQLCEYRDAIAELEATGARIVGISKDAPAKHREFRQAHGLPFPLLSDPTGATGKAYRVTPRWLPFALPSFVGRAIFLVSPEGRIVAEKTETTPFSYHGADGLVAMIKNL